MGLSASNGCSMSSFGERSMVESWIWQEYIAQECVSACLNEFRINSRLALNCRWSLKFSACRLGLRFATCCRLCLE